MKPRLLSVEEVVVALESISNWSFKDGKLHRELQFENFVDAFGFMAKAALVSEKLNHHPDWFNSYNRVRINLSTHEVEGISVRDIDWAKAIEKLL